MDCIFCRIIDGGIPSKKVYEKGDVIAFHDISPKAPVHLLVIHKIHTESISRTPEDKKFIFADLFSAVRDIAEQLNLDDLGYRIIINNGKASGQEVFHVHVHILAGKEQLGPMLAV